MIGGSIFYKGYFFEDIETETSNYYDLNKASIFGEDYASEPKYLKFEIDPDYKGNV
jgi:hypothetical protein